MLRESIGRFQSIGTPYELADANELLASVLSNEDGSPVESLAHLLEAHRLYGKLGCQKACDRVAARIREVEARTTGREPARAEPAEPGATLITESPVLQNLVATVRDLARGDSTILIQGETGTGKELVARLIHDSGAPDDTLVPVNCGALPQQLLESELFGHRKGAFTGADKDRTGILQSAGDGTVFLDEIDKGSPDFQVRLLRVIETREVRPVGSDDFHPLGARILCASNRDLKELVQKGAFLPDLYYRLSAFCFTIPPLRERTEDIALLAGHFLRSLEGRFGSVSYELTEEAEALLLSYGWPGNVRELKNVMEAAAFYARETGVVSPEQLPQDIRFPVHGPHDSSLTGQIEDLERREILAAMERAKGVKTRAAQILGISRKGLRDRLRRLGLD